MDLFTFLFGLAGLGVLVAAYFALGMYRRKRFMILYHSEALTELTHELRRIANALEGRASQPSSEPRAATKPDGRSVANSMLGR